MNKTMRRAVVRSRLNSEYYMTRNGQKMTYPSTLEQDTVTIAKKVIENENT